LIGIKLKLHKVSLAWRKGKLSIWSNATYHSVTTQNIQDDSELKLENEYVTVRSFYKIDGGMLATTFEVGSRDIDFGSFIIFFVNKSVGYLLFYIETRWDFFFIILKSESN